MRLQVFIMHWPYYFQATGDIVDEDSAPNGLVSGWDYANEKFDMKVPERILVMGQDQHIGKGTCISFNFMPEEQKALCESTV